jgi:hypothetical protein
LMFGAILSDSNANIDLIIEQDAAATSLCPIFDLTDPINSGFSLFLSMQYTLSMASHSTGSPDFVPWNAKNRFEWKVLITIILRGVSRSEKERRKKKDER